MIEQSTQLAHARGLTHGFTTRRGGVSTGAFDSLNFGRGLGDPDENIAGNLHCLRELVQLDDPTPIIELDQVHGAEVLLIERGAPSGQVADGMITWTPGVALAVRTADCAPLLFAHVVNGRADAVAAVHAGWRGATAGIARRTIDKLDSLGASTADLVVAIGPTIGIDAFEVGDEVIEAAASSIAAEVPMTSVPGQRRHLDLRGLIRQQLIEAGVRPASIELVGGCTAANPDRYFSYRRDAGRTGRHLSLIALEPA